ncbi:MAG: hypothetical protein R3F55_20935 [Alphaproteobacteria bacterium]
MTLTDQPDGTPPSGSLVVRQRADGVLPELCSHDPRPRRSISISPPTCATMIYMALWLDHGVLAMG